MFNIGSVFNTALVGQANVQRGNNVAILSAFTTQNLIQAAANNATLVQG